MVGKIVCGIIVGFVLLAASASYSKASDQSVVMTFINAGVSGGASKEAIVLHNNSDQVVEMTGWCLENKAALRFFCFSDSTDPQVAYQLGPNASAVVMSKPYAESVNATEQDGVFFAPTSQTSGSLVGSGDTLRLIDAENNERDRYTWTTASTGLYPQRLLLEGQPPQYQLTWQLQPLTELPPHQLERLIQPAEPPQPPSMPVRVMMTELFPNPAGVDDGQEFIELFNGGSEAVSLDGYVITINSSTQKSFIVPSGLSIEPSAYVVLTQSMVPFVLPNTQASLALTAPDGSLVATTAQYNSPADGVSWSLIGESWYDTKPPTPGAENRMALSAPTLALSTAPSGTLKPCTETQYRSSETNRCRNLPVVAAAIVAPCKAGQYRNADTNRCRNIETPPVVAACKEGQERNPETGRCKTVRSVVNMTGKVLTAQTENKPQQWYIVWIIVALLCALVLYAVWEWRREIIKLSQRLRAFVIRPK